MLSCTLLYAPRCALRCSLLCALLCALPSCAAFNYYHIRRYEPIAEATTRGLAASKASLQTCLDELGAPVKVWQSPSGMILAYAWLDRVFWRFEAQAYGVRQLSGRTLFRYENTNDGFRGAVLVFDEDLNLQAVRHGMLEDITRAYRRRPAAVE